MGEILGCLIIVAASLPFAFIIHWALCKWHQRRGQRLTQGTALTAALLTTVFAAVMSGVLARHRPNFWPSVLYTTALSGAVAYVYFVMFCNTESGRRYRVLELLFHSPGITAEEIHSAYSTRYVLEKRLERMRKWGIIEESSGQVRIRKRSSVWTARLFGLWGRILAFPVWECLRNHVPSSISHLDAATRTAASEGKQTAPRDFTRAGGLWMVCGYLLVLAVTAIYCYKTGLVLILADSQFLVDRSKHIGLQGNLNLSPGTTLAYPPLYSLLLSPAYLLSNPKTINIALRLINVLIYSLTFFPIWGILKSYSKLEGHALWLGSVFLALLPCTLPWASILLTEVLYLPLAYWFFYGLVTFLERPSFRRAAILGLILGLCHLTRAAGGVVVISFLAVGLLDTIRQFRRTRSWVRTASEYAAALCVYGLIVFCWRLMESVCVAMPDNRGYGAIVLNAMKRTVSTGADFSLHVHWFVNCLLYYLTGSLTLAGVFVSALCLLRPRLLVQDPFISFALLCVLGSALCIFLFFDSSLGEPPLIWNKYLIPYVLPILVIALRYRASGGWEMRTACIAAVGILALASLPSRLVCFMPDSLTSFTMPRHCFGLSASWRAAGYFAAVVVPLGLARLPWRWGKVLGVVSLFGVWTFASLGASAHWRESHLNQRNSSHLGKRICQELREEPSLALHHEPPYIFTGIDMRAKIYVPKTDIPIQRLEQIVSSETSLDRDILLLTTRNIAAQRPVATDWGRWKLYRFSLASMRRQHAIGLGCAEVLDGSYEFSQRMSAEGKPVFITEMKPSFTVKAYSSRPGAQAEVRLKVATLQQIPKDIQLRVKGQSIGSPIHVGPEYSWPHVLTAKWHLPLETEESILEFTVTPPQPISLPRPAGVLLVEEPEVEILSPSSSGRVQE